MWLPFASEIWTILKTPRFISLLNSAILELSKQFWAMTFDALRKKTRGLEEFLEEMVAGRQSDLQTNVF